MGALISCYGKKEKSVKWLSENYFFRDPLRPNYIDNKYFFRCPFLGALKLESYGLAVKPPSTINSVPVI